jgi:transcription initiation factor TFIIIB Brf1 subunit/transcription initiation factor TFIIB
MKDTIICPECGKKHLIDPSNDVVWEEGELMCDCGKLIIFENERLKTLYI